MYGSENGTSNNQDSGPNDDGSYTVPDPRGDVPASTNNPMDDESYYEDMNVPAIEDPVDPGPEPVFEPYTDGGNLGDLVGAALEDPTNADMNVPAFDPGASNSLGDEVGAALEDANNTGDPNADMNTPATEDPNADMNTPATGEEPIDNSADIDKMMKDMGLGAAGAGIVPADNPAIPAPTTSPARSSGGGGSSIGGGGSSSTKSSPAAAATAATATAHVVTSQRSGNDLIRYWSDGHTDVVKNYYAATTAVTTGNAKTGVPKAGTTAPATLGGLLGTVAGALGLTAKPVPANTAVGGNAGLTAGQLQQMRLVAAANASNGTAAPGSSPTDPGILGNLATSAAASPLLVVSLIIGGLSLFKK